MKKIGLFLAIIWAVLFGAQALAETKAKIPLPKMYQVGNFWKYHFYCEVQPKAGTKTDKMVTKSNGKETWEVGVVVTEGEVETKIVKMEKKGHFTILTLKNNYRSKVKNEASEEAKIFALPKDFLVFDSSTGALYACDQKKMKELLAEKSEKPDPDYVFDLKVGKKWAEIPEREIKDDRYCFFVEKKEDVKVMAGLFKQCFKIVYYTAPDHSIEWFDPKVGKVKEECIHHGSVMNYKSELKKFGKK